MRIVLIEDNTILARAMIQALEEEGHAVDWLANGDDAADFLMSEGGDLAIIDINLPKRSGLDILRMLGAERREIAVLVLTARNGLADRINGLDAGADDYMTKPFEMAELSARIRALGRRRGQRVHNVEMFGQLHFDRLSRQLLGPDGPLVLPRRELALWEVLSDNAERVVSKDALCDSIYGTGADVEVNAVELLVSRLRRKIEPFGIMIVAVRGLGYVLRVAVAQ